MIEQIINYNLDIVKNNKEGLSKKLIKKYKHCLNVLFSLKAKYKLLSSEEIEFILGYKENDILTDSDFDVINNDIIVNGIKF